MLKSIDGGQHWSNVTIPGTASMPTQQTYYNLILAVDPQDAATVYFGEVRLWRSNNGGTSWTDVSIGTSPTANVALHGDQHAIAFHPSSPGRLYIGNDGGVYRSNDACANWISCNKGLQITQFNSLAYAGPAAMVAGTQDNGVLVYSGDPAFTLTRLTGDGGAVQAPPRGQSSSQRWHATRSISNDLGIWWSDNAGVPGAWNAPEVAGLPPPSDSDVYGSYPPFLSTPWGLIYASNRLWLQAAPGQQWQAITPQLTTASGAYITTLDLMVMPRVGKPAPRDYTLLVGTVEGLAWQILPPGWAPGVRDWQPAKLQGLPGAPVTQIKSGYDSRNRKTMYVAVTSGFSAPHVWLAESSDPPTASPFRPISAPPLADSNPANCVWVNRNSWGYISVYVGCDVGVFSGTISPRGSASWQRMDQPGLPNVAVVAVEPGDVRFNSIRVATHGRGIWERDYYYSPGGPGLIDVCVRHSDYRRRTRDTRLSV